MVGRESGRAMATTSSQLLCTSFLGQAALPMRSGFAGVNSGRSTCRVTCASSLSSAVRESLKMAVIIPVAAFTVLTASPQADAGILSGASGMESVQLPPIPEPGFLKQLQDDKRKMYEGQDETFKNSSYLQELLKKSKDNAALHKKEIADKYCERGAEWGVGDCSLMGMTQEQKENFMKVLKQK